MQLSRRVLPIGIVAAVMALIVAIATVPDRAGAADHLDAPGLTSPGGFGDLDINDLYVFDGDGDSTVIALTVSPVAGADAKFATAFKDSYSIRIDTNGDAREDITYNVRFFGEFRGDQGVLVQRAVRSHARSTRPRGRLAGLGLTDHEIRVRGGGKLLAGLRSDPFFFDLSGFLGSVEGVGVDALGVTPSDFFVDLNTLAIVLEVPDSQLNDGGPIGVWATTQHRDSGWKQVDRIGRPAINTVVNSSGPLVMAPTEAKNVYNAGKPRDDVDDFRDAVITALQVYSSLDPVEGAYTDGQAGALADILLPDILTFDKASELPAPLNGRALADDVIDTELRIVTGGDPLGLLGRDADGGINSDGVGPHGDYLAVFPYLGPAH